VDCTGPSRAWKVATQSPEAPRLSILPACRPRPQRKPPKSKTPHHGATR
jgi:hypothetical protein